MTPKDQITMQEPNRPSVKRESRPPDIDAMRSTANELLAQSDVLPRHDHLAEMVHRLRSHFTLLIPAVEGLTQILPDGHPIRESALTALNTAGIRLNTTPAPGLVAATQHARSLARDLLALCAHYEAHEADREQRQPS